MKEYLGKLNGRIDQLVDALKKAEGLISEYTSEEAITALYQKRNEEGFVNPPKISDVFDKES